jgi:hypothetical protein
MATKLKPAFSPSGLNKVDRSGSGAARAKGKWHQE